MSKWAASTLDAAAGRKPTSPLSTSSLALARGSTLARPAQTGMLRPSRRSFGERNLMKRPAVASSNDTTAADSSGSRGSAGVADAAVARSPTRKATASPHRFFATAGSGTGSFAALGQATGAATAFDVDHDAATASTNPLIAARSGADVLRSGSLRSASASRWRPGPSSRMIVPPLGVAVDVAEAHPETPSAAASSSADAHDGDGDGDGAEVADDASDVLTADAVGAATSSTADSATTRPSSRAAGHGRAPPVINRVAGRGGSSSASHPARDLRPAVSRHRAAFRPNYTSDHHDGTGSRPLTPSAAAVQRAAALAATLTAAFAVKQREAGK